MKTAIVWIEYEKEGSESIYTYEYATIGAGGGDYVTLKGFLNELKKLAKTSGYTLNVERVVIG